MKRRIIATLAVVAAVAVPTQASAATVPLARVTAIVKKEYTQQIRARAQLAGYKFISATLKCAVVGHNQWTCYGTYTIEINGTHAKYGQYINVTTSSWKAIGNGTLLKEW